MHNNYYFLRQLSRSLELWLKGGVITECFSQNKDELVIRFLTTSGERFLKASLLPAFSCLSFPDTFFRARKNSIDLFEEMIGLKAQAAYTLKNERSLAISLNNAFTLLFKMHGNRANIILFKDEKPIKLFKNNMVSDRELTLSSLDRDIDWSYENFLRHRDKLSSLYFTFGKVVWRYLEEQSFNKETPARQWEMLQQLRTTLEHPDDYYITRISGTPVLSLLPTGDIQKKWKDPLLALNDFFYTFTQSWLIDREKNAVLAQIKSRIANSTAYCKKIREKLEELERQNNYKIWADLIMANLHRIGPGTEKITLENFYNNSLPVEISLKKDISPQKNAEIFYRKAKNQHIETDRLKKALREKEEEIRKLESDLVHAEASADLKTLKKLHSEVSVHASEKKREEFVPYRETVFNGFHIWVGKNAQSNDVLTLKYGYKEDLWLHARDVQGAHVLIKYQAGKKFPRDVVERAAQLAAYHSGRRSESLCPVVVTPRKFVRKRKGDPPGLVVVDKEEVILVEPKP